MTVVRKYPTVATNPDSWDDPDNALGAADDLCSEKRIVGTASKYLYLSGYGFAIPVGSTINHIYVNHKGVINCAILGAQVLHFSFIFNSQVGNSRDSDVIMGAGCAQTYYEAAYDIKPDFDSAGNSITVAALNAETFTTHMMATGALAVFQAFDVDAAYIEVDYTEPVAAATAIQGDGLTFWTRGAPTRQKPLKPRKSLNLTEKNKIEPRRIINKRQAHELQGRDHSRDGSNPRHGGLGVYAYPRLQRLCQQPRAIRV